MNKLQDWAWKRDMRLRDFPLREQRKYDQRNTTCGRIVPVDVIEKEVGFKCWQLDERPATVPFPHASERPGS